MSQKKGLATPQTQMSNLLRPNQHFTGRGRSFGTFGDKSPRNTVGFGAKLSLVQCVGVSNVTALTTFEQIVLVLA